MENSQLLDHLSRLGYSLLETKENFDVNKTLSDVVKSDNVRFLEGFPVLLANAAKEGGLDYSKVEALLKSKGAKDLFKKLVLLSLALYKANNLYFDWARDLESKLNDKDKEYLKSLKDSLNDEKEMKVGRYKLHLERVLKAFRNYFVHEAQEVKNVSEKHSDLSLEFALSQVFSSKQKDLFKKKLKGEELTKTEKEYFSRTVKKKAAALANPELHRLAQQVYQN